MKKNGVFVVWGSSLCIAVHASVVTLVALATARAFAARPQLMSTALPPALRVMPTLLPIASAGALADGETCACGGQGPVQE
jgi:hypothetical protein